MTTHTTHPNRAILFGGEKGGSGKTTAARLVLDRLRQRENAKVAAADGDGAVGQLLQYHGARTAEGRLCDPQDPINGVLPFDIRDLDSKDRGVETLLQAGADHLLADLPGGALDELAEMSRRGAAELMREFAQAGYAPTVVLTTTPMFATARALKRIHDTLGDSVNYVVIRNLFFARDRDDFVFLDKGEGLRRVLELGGVDITLPALQPRVYAMLDYHSLTVSAALASDSPLGRRDRKHVQEWREDVDAQLDEAAGLLGLTLQGQPAG